MIGIEQRNMVQTFAQTYTLCHPFLQRFWAMEAEYFARAGLGVTAIGEAGDDAGALVEKR